MTVVGVLADGADRVRQGDVSGRGRQPGDLRGPLGGGGEGRVEDHPVALHRQRAPRVIPHELHPQIGQRQPGAGGVREPLRRVGSGGRLVAGRDEHRVHPARLLNHPACRAIADTDRGEVQQVPQRVQFRERHRRDLLGGVQIEPPRPRLVRQDRGDLQRDGGGRIVPVRQQIPPRHRAGDLHGDRHVLPHPHAQPLGDAAVQHEFARPGTGDLQGVQQPPQPLVRAEQIDRAHAADRVALAGGQPGAEGQRGGDGPARDGGAVNLGGGRRGGRRTRP